MARRNRGYHPPKSFRRTRYLDCHTCGELPQDQGRQCKTCSGGGMWIVMSRRDDHKRYVSIKQRAKQKRLAAQRKSLSTKEATTP